MGKTTLYRQAYDHDPLPAVEQCALDDMVERDFKHVLKRMWDGEAPDEDAGNNRRSARIETSEAEIAEAPRLRR